MAKAVGRGVIGILLGLVVISGLTESFEFGIVSLLNGGVVTDPETYFAARNQTPGWVWLLLILLTAPAIVVGGRLRLSSVGSELGSRNPSDGSAV